MSKRDTIGNLRRDAPLLTAGVASADLMNLGAAIRSVEDAGVRLLHFDVMDGRFCPMLTFGPAFIQGVTSPLLKDVHLMIDEPIDALADYVKAGADLVVVNIESTRHVHRCLQILGQMENASDPSRGIIRGVALCPGTSLGAVEPLLGDLDLVCLLAVNPGWGGQAFIPAVKDKLADLVARVRDSGREILTMIDGGITQENIAEIAALGPDILVAGSAVFKGDDPGDNATKLTCAARQGRGS
jgi:ribulose-phosphate 3-epimerase